MIKKLLALFLTFTLSQVVQASTIVNEIAEQYVQLALAVGEHDKNYIDAYYGPKEWREAANKNQISLTTVIKAGKIILSELVKQKASDELSALRLAYLNIQINSLISRATMLNNNIQYEFDKEAELLYNTVPPKKALSEFEPILKKLNQLLPGKAPLAERVAQFKESYEIPTEKLERVFEAAIKECRERTKKYINLLENENFSLEYVTDKPWSGYNWYQGNGQSLIQLNTELPVDISRAVDLGCHEGYPGHHTYNGLLEENLFHKQGWVEFSVYPLFSPQSLIAEGSANFGIEMAFPNEEKAEFEKKILYPLAGLNPATADKHIQVTELLSQLSYAGNEVARLYRNGKINSDEAQSMFQKYTLMSEQKAKQRVRFVDTYGAYVINYNWGKDLVKKWVDSGDDQSREGRWQRFSQLLSSPRLPKTLSE
ncbi:hypothetical protein [Aliikangiella maris]|uniref:DUF885 domain-containing protein n=2 Tax=Aliikangiella maris TaxID=3162458 RepID=A0ABV2BWZ5_9GAMM